MSFHLFRQMNSKVGYSLHIGQKCFFNIFNFWLPCHSNSATCNHYVRPLCMWLTLGHIELFQVSRSGHPPLSTSSTSQTPQYITQKNLITIFNFSRRCHHHSATYHPHLQPLCAATMWLTLGPHWIFSSITLWSPTSIHLFHPFQLQCNIYRLLYVVNFIPFLTPLPQPLGNIQPPTCNHYVQPLCG